jgi:hypothetical protein
MPLVVCPMCREILRMGAEDAGKNDECPTCGHSFILPEPFPDDYFRHGMREDPLPPSGENPITRRP